METIIIAGGSGIIGSHLSKLCEEQGYRVYVLTRNAQKAKNNSRFIHWNLEEGTIDSRMKEANHIINLAGSGIADGRWTAKRRKQIIDSRVDSTQLLIRTIQDENLPIQSYISASAIGYYGDGGDRLLEEHDEVVTKEFLSEVCVKWEEAAWKAESLVNHLGIIRIGTVLSPAGGALSKMATTIPYGVANYLGSGKQLMSWVHLEDISGIFLYAIKQKLSGVYNGVAPEVLTNKDFTNQLRKAINPRSLLLPAPAFGIQLAFGEMSRVVLNSSNISSKKIESSGFEFKYPTLQKALGQLYPS